MSSADRSSGARPFAGAALLPRNYVSIIKVVAAGLCLIPFAIVIGRILGIGSFGPNPVEEVLRNQ